MYDDYESECRDMKNLLDFDKLRRDKAEFDKKHILGTLVNPRVSQEHIDSLPRSYARLYDKNRRRKVKYPGHRVAGFTI